MSVIFGKYNLKNTKLSPNSIAQMSESLNHWNADDSGIWKNDFIGLGHLMLWINKRNLTEKQPYQSITSQNVITADARIDNRGELLSLLEGVSDDTSDSELILLAYEKWERECVKYLIGDFSFCIWDEDKQHLFCARDHLGVRPLLYYKNNDTFIFSTEIRGIDTFDFITPKFYKGFEYQYLADKGVDYNISPFENIHYLPPASYLIVSKDTFLVQEYWALNPDYSIDGWSDEAYQERFNYLLKQAVSARIDTVYPISVELSGGLDSTGLAALVHPYAKKYNIPFHALAYTLPQSYHGKVTPYTDDKPLIEEAAAMIGIENLHFLDWENRNYLADIDLLLSIFHHPQVFKTLLMTDTSCKKANSLGSRILLGGSLGDQGVSWREDSYLEWAMSFQWYKIWEDLNQTKGVIQAFSGLAKIIVKYNLLHRYKKIIEEADNQMLQDEEIKHQLKKVNNNFNKVSSPKTKNRQISIINIVKPRLSQDSALAIHHKIQPVFPLADIRLLEYFLALPIEQKYKLGVNRRLFRNSMIGLIPASIRKAKKSKIFSVPSTVLYFIKNHDEISRYLLANKTKVLSLKYLNYEYLKTCLKTSNRTDDFNRPKITMIFFALSLIKYFEKFPNRTSKNASK